jgi:hypothetical protein
MKKLTIIVSLLACMASLGCVALSEYVTPASIDQQAVNYAVRAGVIDANDFDGYGNLAKANRLAWLVDDAHERNQLTLAQQIDKDALDYSQLSDTVHTNVKAARQQEETLFGEKGILSLGLGLAGFGSLTGIVGLMRKRPGDMTPEEVKAAVTGTKEALTEKETQIVEIVKGVQKFIADQPPTSSMMMDLKKRLDRSQSASTKETVAKIKATL